MKLSVPALREFSAAAVAAGGPPLFDGFSDADLEALVAQMHGVLVPDGDRVALPEGLWLVLRGVVRVSHVRPDAPPIELGELGPGAFLGHLGLILGIDDPTVAVAVDTVVCARMSGGTFARWTASGDLAAVRFQRLLARRLVRQLRVANVRLLELAARPELRDFARTRGLVA